jgi:hypothetical protein
MSLGEAASPQADSQECPGALTQLPVNVSARRRDRHRRRQPAGFVGESSKGWYIGQRCTDVGVTGRDRLPQGGSHHPTTPQRCPAMFGTSDVASLRHRPSPATRPWSHPQHQTPPTRPLIPSTKPHPRLPWQPCPRHRDRRPSYPISPNGPDLTPTTRRSHIQAIRHCRRRVVASHLITDTLGPVHGEE